MKIVFIQPNVGFHGHTWEALGIGYIISNIKKYYPEIDIDFYSGFYDTDKTIIDGCRGADIIGFGCSSPQYKHALKLAYQIKGPDNLIVFGGIHPTALPEQVLKEPCIDIVVQGEGELALLHIISAYKANFPIDKDFKASKIEDIDNLPYPDRHTIKNERNIEQAYKDTGRRIASILSGRGCPYNCSFCCSHCLWGRKPRLRSPKNIVTEFENLVYEWGIQFVKFSDDTFTLDKQRVIDFCRLKMEMDITTPFGCNAHVKTVDETMIHWLADANCEELWYGVESGSPKILKAMHKHTDIQSIKDAFRLTKDYGIKTRAYFLLGMPGETLEDIKLTEQLCDELQPDIIGFSILSPFPCNEYYDPVLMKDWDWSTFDEYSNPIASKQSLYAQYRLIEKYKDNLAFVQRGKT